MSQKLYIGNLSFSATEEDLQSFFGAAGEVTEVQLVIDKFTGKSRGFAFVTYADAESAQKAISQFDGTEFQSRQLRVSEARPKSEHPSGGRREHRGDGRRGGSDDRPRRDYNR